MWTGLLFIAYNGVVTKLYLNCRELIRRGIFTSCVFLAVVGTGIELAGFQWKNEPMCFLGQTLHLTSFQ